LLSEKIAPTVIYIEEAWFMLANPYFRQRIRDWLKTLPKRLANLVMATQSLDDLSESGVFSAIADNIPTRIFLANRNAVAQSELYRDQFGLNNGQIQRIAHAQPKRQFLVVQPSSSRFIDLNFSPEMIAVLRSDLKAQVLFDQCFASGCDDWVRHYLQCVEELDQIKQENAA
jgi:type IV secretion system protein VirB4